MDDFALSAVNSKMNRLNVKLVKVDKETIKPGLDTFKISFVYEENTYYIRDFIASHRTKSSRFIIDRVKAEIARIEVFKIQPYDSDQLNMIIKGVWSKCTGINLLIVGRFSNYDHFKEGLGRFIEENIEGFEHEGGFVQLYRFCYENFVTDEDLVRYEKENSVLGGLLSKKESNKILG